MEDQFHQKLKKLIHEFVLFVYKVTPKFPTYELYGVTSQLRRASMSIMLNYIEGYARKRNKVKLTFYETAHGSSQESKYLVFFASLQKWISPEEFKYGDDLVEQIGRMLWSTIDGLEDIIDKEK
jgi:four helix bundle protein